MFWLNLCLETGLHKYSPFPVPVLHSWATAFSPISLKPGSLMTMGLFATPHPLPRCDRGEVRWSLALGNWPLLWWLLFPSSCQGWSGIFLRYSLGEPAVVPIGNAQGRPLSSRLWPQEFPLLHKSTEHPAIFQNYHLSIPARLLIGPSKVIDSQGLSRFFSFYKDGDDDCQYLHKSELSTKFTSFLIPHCLHLILSLLFLKYFLKHSQF